MKHPFFNIIKLPLLVTVILLGLYWSLISNTNSRHESVNKDLKGKRALVLSPDCDVALLDSIIFNNGYASSESDARFIADTLVARMKRNGSLPSLYSLQKRAIGQVVPVIAGDTVQHLTSIWMASCKKLGQDELRSLEPYKRDTANAGDGVMIVVVKDDEKKPCEGVKVRLLMHFRDVANNVKSDTMGYVATGPDGKARFEGLDTSKSYSVLPIAKGFEYGPSRGTNGGRWNIDEDEGGMTFEFTQREHRIPMFSNAALRQIKNERAIMVRSPHDYKNTLMKWFLLVLAGWWVMILVMSRRHNTAANVVASAVMLLTGLCVLMMFSMQDPLNDELHGVTMAQGVLIGLAACLVLQRVDFVKFYQKKDGFDIPLYIFRWIFKPYKQKIAGLGDILKGDAGILKKLFAMLIIIITLPLLLLDVIQLTRLSKPLEKLCDKLPKGIGWLFTALIITALLWTPLGQAIGGMKVNLNMMGIKFQPSEIAKYLILLFMAAFFTRQANAIIAYSQPYGIKKIKEKLKTLVWIIIGLAVLMAMYAALGDMGPALVIGITFILLYSLVKSKVNLENIDDDKKVERIFSCDFAMLVYGVLSFVLFLIIGYSVGHIILMGFMWFVFWILFGIFAFKKQLFESPLLMNAIVFVFILGGNLGDIDIFKDNSIVKRFSDRNSMCVNTWGDHIITDEELGQYIEPVSNNQVANGLWSLASGGFFGQGLGNGKPSVTPAFHTDMILSSVGEQLGWLGLLIIVLALFVLLRRMAVIGYNVGHPFAFYLCLGFSIVIGVQFFIIALGSTGVIPLTGVTVPFLSFGRVSMILNLAAIGIVLSLSNKIGSEQQKVTQYSYPIAMLTLVFIGFAMFTLMMWQHYQVWRRNSTLIHPAFVINRQGAPSVEYNPRIVLLTQNLHAGRIYDRNGVLLATSDRNELAVFDKDNMEYCGLNTRSIKALKKSSHRRYYPFGENMFFMLGDQNSKLYFNSWSEDNPIGYMAEARHEAYLRGYDNVMRDEDGKAVEMRGKTDQLKENSFLTKKDTIITIKGLKNHEALLKYLKDGIDGDLVKRHNEELAKTGDYDLHLTIDAALQTDLQNRIAHHAQDNVKDKNKNLLRISVVVLDAKNGDLLASANYPLPDYQRLMAEEEIAQNNGKNFAVYNDNYKDASWQAYTDRDLGTTYQTYPGSTAKIMSAMAGFKKLGMDAKNVSYRITNANAIDVKGNNIWEPTIDNPNEKYRHNPVTMEWAIVQSSNCYFINLVNDKELYDSLKPVYSTIGIEIAGITPYYYSMRDDSQWKQNDYYAIIDKTKNEAKAKYDLFVEGNLRDPKAKIKTIKPMEETNMRVPEWKWAWGQGFSGSKDGENRDLRATPLNMARVVSTVINGGEMPVTQYVKGVNGYEKSLRNEGTISLINSNEANVLKGYMLAESANRLSARLPSFVGGKSGTPERGRPTKDNKYNNVNDGWYVFFAADNEHQPVAVAVRMERLGSTGSSAAVTLVKDEILPCLKDKGYIKEY